MTSRRLLALLLLLATPTLFGAANIVIINVDPPGQGFNDPTPAAPVGGNTGTTVGQQRLNVFKFVAGIWAAKIDSNVEIRIQSTFQPLPCDSVSGVLGAAGPMSVFADFPGEEYAGTWYVSALANKLAGQDLDPGAPGTDQDDIIAFFNSDIGTPACLAGLKWYYGLDTNTPPGTSNLSTTVLHEFGHGLGFLSLVDETTGQPFFGLMDVYSIYLRDNSTGKTWDVMNDAERAASAINPLKLSWDGLNATLATSEVLSFGTPILRIKQPGGIEGVYDAAYATFGPLPTVAGLKGNIVLALDPSDAAGASTTDACSPLTNAAAVFGKIALIDRGGCVSTVKVRNAQAAGAVGVILVDNQDTVPPPIVGGTDPTIVIPVIRVTKSTGLVIKGALGSAVLGEIAMDPKLKAGADAQGRPLMFSPNPDQPGSSVSHFEANDRPSQLMGPFDTGKEALLVDIPRDLTMPLFRDLGWVSDDDGVPDGRDLCLKSSSAPTVVINGCSTGVTNFTFVSGCRVTDLVQGCRAAGSGFPTPSSCVSALASALQGVGLITPQQQQSLTQCGQQIK